MGDKHTSAVNGSDKRSDKKLLFQRLKVIANIVGYALDISGTGEVYTTLCLLLIKLCIKAVSIRQTKNRKQPPVKETGDEKLNDT